MAVLQSRTLAEEVIRALDLMPRLFPEQWDAVQRRWREPEPPTLQDGVRALQDMVSVTTDRKTGLITIAVEHTDPQLAATIANQYIMALQQALNEKAFSLAKKNRVFVEEQLHKTQQALTAAEEALRAFEEQHGIVALDAQAEAAINAIATLESQIMAKEVQLRVLQRTMTGASREVVQLQEELQGLRQQLAKLQRGQAATADSQALLSLDKAPEVKLQYARLQREVQLQNKLFALLSQQLEQARIEEARDETAFQVLDPAIPPERKVKPRRRMTVMLATVVGGMLGVFAAFFFEYLDTRVRRREQVERQAGLPVLAVLPPLPPPPRRQRRQPANDAPLAPPPPGTPLLEALRYWHTRLRRLETPPRVLLLVSPAETGQTAPLLVQLAMVAAASGERVLLIDGNLRQPSLHHLLATAPSPGLAELLLDPQAWPKGVQGTAVDNLFLLPAGTLTPAAAAALESAACDAVLAQARATYDLVLCAAPPVLTTSDAAVLGSKADAVCLLLVAGQTSLEAVNEARGALEAVQARVIGAVLSGSQQS
ncbi:MAG: hypothetical protein KatS3mg131_0769 [Candidatus Tectimicrobiota bacterium]|nr:MAG: hypothetical protein KatS3mg131_0769 [Candidatus Tectomicrobia bacterium]